MRILYLFLIIIQINTFCSELQKNFIKQYTEEQVNNILTNAEKIDKKPLNQSYLTDKTVSYVQKPAPSLHKKNNSESDKLIKYQYMKPPLSDWNDPENWVFPSVNFFQSIPTNIPQLRFFQSIPRNISSPYNNTGVKRKDLLFKKLPSSKRADHESEKKKIRTLSIEKKECLHLSRQRQRDEKQYELNKIKNLNDPETIVPFVCQLVEEIIAAAFERINIEKLIYGLLEGAENQMNNFVAMNNIIFKYYLLECINNLALYCGISEIKNKLFTSSIFEYIFENQEFESYILLKNNDSYFVISWDPEKQIFKCTLNKTIWNYMEKQNNSYLKIEIVD